MKKLILTFIVGVGCVSGYSAGLVNGTLSPVVGPTASSITNGFATTNYVNAATTGIVTNLPPSNGTNDAPMLQSLLSRTNIIYGGGQIYVSLTNLYLTNSVTVKDITINFSNIIGIGLDARLVTNISYSGVVLDGGRGSNYQSLALLPFPLFNPATYPPQGGNNPGPESGFGLNCSGGGSVIGCTAKNFDDVGFLLLDINGTQAYTAGQRLLFANNSAYSDYVGLHANANDYVGYPVVTNVNPSSFAGSSAEYMNIVNFVGQNCGVGLYSGCGNFNIDGATLTGNKIGIGGYGLSNPMKGRWSNLTLNHNSYAGYLRSGVIHLENVNALASTIGPFYIGGGSETFIIGGKFDTTVGGFAPIVVTNDFSNKTGRTTSLVLMNCFNSTLTPTNFVIVGSSNASALLINDTDDQGNDYGTLTQGACLITNALGTGFGTFSYLGIGLTNLPSTNVNFTIIQTNFIGGQIYVNNYGAPIELKNVGVYSTVAAIAGFSQLQERVPGIGTNYSPMIVTAITGTLTGNVTNTMSTGLIIPVGSTYTLTNTSTGAGNGATNFGGQILIY